MSRKFVLGIVFMSLFAVSITGVQAKNANAEKVDICHYTGDGDWHIINVSENAVDAHFANHGDAFPGEFYFDGDGDGYGDANGDFIVCPEPGYVANNLDCNDEDATIFPNGEYYPDTDGDGFGDASGEWVDCLVPGYVDDATDCDDTDGTVFPGAEDICDDGIDNNCDGEVDEGCVAECGEEVQAENTRYASSTNDFWGYLISDNDAYWQCRISGVCEFGCVEVYTNYQNGWSNCTYDEASQQVTCQAFCICPEVTEYQQYQDATVEEEGEFDEEEEQ